MNPSPQASKPSKKAQRQLISFDLNTARRMLPLVKSIVTDINTGHKLLNELNPEQERLERNRRTLTWNERERRYQISDDIRKAEKHLTNASVELEELGVTLIDSRTGMVAFPTRINGRSAAYSWQFDEESISFWHYQDEKQRRPIPAEWTTSSTVNA